MAGIRVVYFKDAAGKDRVRITGTNGEPMFTSEAYERPGTARQAVSILADAFQLGDVYVVTPGDEDQAELKGGADAGAGDDSGVTEAGRGDQSADAAGG